MITETCHTLPCIVGLKKKINENPNHVFKYTEKVLKMRTVKARHFFNMDILYTSLRVFFCLRLEINNETYAPHKQNAFSCGQDEYTQIIFSLSSLLTGTQGYHANLDSMKHPLEPRSNHLRS